MTDEKASRRRGKALDNAILAAAWEELLTNGYAGFTMENVATRAGTSRPVLARRWQNRAELAVAALAFYVQQHPIVVPDLGSVREELAMLLQKISERGVSTVNTVLLGMRDYFEETSTSMNDLGSKLSNSATVAMHEVLERAIGRGEIDRRKLSKRIASLPFDLMRHETFMTNRPITKRVIGEILDTIFLPLVAPSRNSLR